MYNCIQLEYFEKLLLNCLTVGGRHLVQELGHVLVPGNVSVVIAKGKIKA